MTSDKPTAAKGMVHSTIGDGREGLEGLAPGLKICTPILRYCKRGHLRSDANTFPRRTTVGGKVYIVRECRQCHADRNNPSRKRRRRADPLINSAPIPVFLRLRGRIE